MQKAITLWIAGLLFASSFAHGQQLQIAALPLVVNGMAAHNVYESQWVGIANARSPQFARYQQLVHIATQHQLLSLAAGHANAVVRLYAYQALQERDIAIPDSLQQKFKNDQTPVHTLEGCIANKQPVHKLAAKRPSKSNFRVQHFAAMQFAEQ